MNKLETQKVFFLIFVSNNISEKKTVPDIENFVEIFVKRELKRPTENTCQQNNIRLLFD